MLYGNHTTTILGEVLIQEVAKVSFGLMKLIDTYLRCRLCQENLARCMHICENYWGPFIKQYFKVGRMPSQPSPASVSFPVI